MKLCDWCYSQTSKSVTISSLGNVYSVCPKCHTFLIKNTCRICGNKLNNHHIKGKCILCAQVESTIKGKRDSDIYNGAGEYGEVISSIDNPMTEEQVNSWLSFEINPERAKSKAQNQEKLIREKFSRSKELSDSEVSANMKDLLELKNKNPREFDDPNYVVTLLQNIGKYRNTSIVTVIGQLVILKKS